ncbi:hypothetical protein KUTeg_013243 [Tegillarca granosa]|uniref:FBA domain-containing protein n=1 Tax=Tegillarca granosa TaxID=220873 RepID=A0ABQ9ETH8_TEGGR|nr:hypothetical protein KUTeg_013243 [Tegillarca granosa]
MGENSKSATNVNNRELVMSEYQDKSVFPITELPDELLINEGCDPEVLDNIKPDIEISEWYSARHDCGINYEIKVKHTFRDYPAGVRYILFQHKGKDTYWWRGHYGAKITLSSVHFKFQNS